MTKLLFVFYYRNAKKDHTLIASAFDSPLSITQNYEVIYKSSASVTYATSPLARCSQTSSSLLDSRSSLITSLDLHCQGVIMRTMVMTAITMMMTMKLIWWQLQVSQHRKWPIPHQRKQRSLVHICEPIPYLLWHRHLCFWGLTFSILIVPESCANKLSSGNQCGPSDREPDDQTPSTCTTQKMIIDRFVIVAFCENSLSFINFPQDMLGWNGVLNTSMVTIAW